MIKLLIFLFAVMPLPAAAQKSEDHILLKNGETVWGRIVKMEGDKIHFVKTIDSVVYRADEIKSIWFCDREKENSPVKQSQPAPCNEEGAGATNRVRTNSGTVAPVGKPAAVKASVEFRCNMCGGTGNLSVSGENEKNKTTANYTFAMDNDRHFFSHTILLPPGEYTWQYHDSRNNAAKGKFVVKNEEERKIILFEQE